MYLSYARLYNWQQDGIGTSSNNAQIRYFTAAIRNCSAEKVTSAHRSMPRVSRARTRTHAPPARRLIIEISHVECAHLWSRSARAPRNATSAWCIHAGPRIQSDLHINAANGVARVESRKPSPPRKSFELRDRSNRKKKTKKILNVRSYTVITKISN